MITTFIRKPNHVDACKEAVPICRKASVQANVLTHVNYKAQGSVPRRYP